MGGHGRPLRQRHIIAVLSGRAGKPVLLDDELARHAAVAETAEDRAAESVGTGALGDKFDDALLIVVELEVVLGFGHAQTGITGLRGAVGIETDLDAVSTVSGANFELNASSFLHANFARREFVLFGGHFDDLSGIATLRLGRKMGTPADKEQTTEKKNNH